MDAEMGRLVHRKAQKAGQTRPKGASSHLRFRLRLGVAAVLVGCILLWAGSGRRGSSEDGSAASGGEGGVGIGSIRGRVTQQQQQQLEPNSPTANPTGEGAAGASGQFPELFTFRVVKEFPHDPTAFTQGLQYDRSCSANGRKCKDVFWESTGLNGRSTVREVELKTGKVLRQAKLPHSDFGEGLTRLGNRLYQITWRSPRTWSYSVSNFSDAKLVNTPLTDGWGITTNGKHLVVGDSTENLYFIHPRKMKTVRSVRVTDGGEAVRWLNELEWVDGNILANVWTTDCIARIDPKTGAVIGWATFRGLKQQMLQGLQGPSQAEVFNGIAWDPTTKRLFVTGKLWPKLYQVELVPLETANYTAELQQIRQQCIIRDTSVLG